MPLRTVTGGRWILTISFICFWLSLSACGTEDFTLEDRPEERPGESPSCESLEPLVFDWPVTGGAFHCLWCNRQWTWAVPEDAGNAFILVAWTCERLRSQATLELRDGHGSMVWQDRVEQGHEAIHCIRYQQHLRQPLHLRLSGTRDVFLIEGLIEEFRGGVFFKVFDERGNPLQRVVF